MLCPPAAAATRGASVQPHTTLHCTALHCTCMHLPCARPLTLSCRYIRTLSRAVAMNGGVSLVEENEELKEKLRGSQQLLLQHDQVSHVPCQ